MSDADLIRLFDAALPEDGVLETELDGISLFRESAPIDRLPGLFPPAACIILQGEKRLYFRGGAHLYDSSRYICSALPLPVEGEVTRASPAEPVLGIMVLFETRAMTEACIAYEAAGGLRGPDSRPRDDFLTPSWDAPFRAAVAGLLEALADPVLLGVVGQGRARELTVAILRGEAGPMICGRARHYLDILKVIEHIRANLSTSLTIERLASLAGMSRASLHRRFKQATSLSPIQFVKTIRLNEGARLMAAGAGVATAASAVGYASASQFSREFKRHFGHAPREWRVGESA